jgi:hypothetical protein
MAPLVDLDTHVGGAGPTLDVLQHDAIRMKRSDVGHVIVDSNPPTRMTEREP